MKQRKTLKELTLKNSFLFGAVMTDEENCRRLLEITLGFPIERVKVSKEKSIVYHSEYRGIRLDVYAKDENNTRYNVEMQVAATPNLQKRSRYYHSQIDMDLLLAGQDYSDLPESYVIFICDFDPFGLGKYRYSFENKCHEVNDLLLREGSHTIFLSTRGQNEQEVPEQMVKFLKFVKAGLEESEQDFEDDFIRKLQVSIRKIKDSREMGERYMTFEELLRDERKAGLKDGRAKSVLTLLSELGEIPKDLEEEILSEADTETLTNLLKQAAKATSIEEFRDTVRL